MGLNLGVDVLNRFLHSHFRRLPVVDEGRLIGQKQPSSDSVNLPGGLGESAQVRIGLARREMLPLLHLVPDVVAIGSQLDVGH